LRFLLELELISTLLMFLKLKRQAERSHLNKFKK